MGGCRCVYRNCESSTTTSPGLHYFHFPVRDPDRCEQWLVNARRPNLRQMPKEKLRNKVVCSLHFEERCFTNEKHDRLVHNAVPSLGCNDYNEAETATAEDENSDDVVLIPINDDNTKFTLPDVEFSGMSYMIYDDNVVPSGSVTEPEPKPKPKKPKFMVTAINKIIPSTVTSTTNVSTNINTVSNIVEDVQGENVVSWSVSGTGDDVMLQPTAERRKEEEDDDVEEIYSYTIETEPKSDGPLLDNDIALKPKRSNEYTLSVVASPTSNVENVKKQETSRVLVKEIRMKPDQSDAKSVNVDPPQTKTHELTKNYITYQDEEKHFIIQTPSKMKTNTYQLPIESEFQKITEKEYMKMIEDNAKQIRSLKRLINKQNKLHRYYLQKRQMLKYRKKPNKNALLYSLKKYVQPSLMAVLKLEVLPDDDVILTDDEEKFLLDLYTENPETYQVLLKKYRWKLPGYEKEKK